MELVRAKMPVPLDEAGTEADPGNRSVNTPLSSWTTPPTTSNESKAG